MNTNVCYAALAGRQVLVGLSFFLSFSPSLSLSLADHVSPLNMVNIYPIAFIVTVITLRFPSSISFSGQQAHLGAGDALLLLLKRFSLTNVLLCVSVTPAGDRVPGTR